MSQGKVLNVDEAAKEIAKMAEEPQVVNELIDGPKEEYVTILKSEFEDTLKTIKDSNNKLVESYKKNEELNDKYLRSLADYQNLQKRTIIQVNNSKLDGKISVFKELLPIIDDFEKAKEVGELTDGVKFIYDKIMNILKTNNIEIINPVEGDKFNDSIHEAVVAIPNPDKEKNTIAYTQFKGYKIDDRVLRYAKVGVYVN